LEKGLIVRDQQTMMIDAQAKHISRLNAEVISLKKEIDRLRDEKDRNRDIASHYLTIQKAIIEHPPLMSAWRQFITMARLTCSEPVEGLTKSSKQQAAESFDYFKTMSIP